MSLILPLLNIYVTDDLIFVDTISSSIPKSCNLLMQLITEFYFPWATEQVKLVEQDQPDHLICYLHISCKDQFLCFSSCIPRRKIVKKYIVAYCWQKKKHTLNKQKIKWGGGGGKDVGKIIFFNWHLCELLFFFLSIKQCQNTDQ